jgi:hypothetical protein
MSVGTMDFKHKTTEGSLCSFTSFFGAIGQVIFINSDGLQCVRPKTWQGLFTAIRSHTRRQLAIRDHGKPILKAA